MMDTSNESTSSKNQPSSYQAQPSNNQGLTLLQDFVLCSVCFYLDADSISRLSTTCMQVSCDLKCADTIQWLSSTHEAVRSLGLNGLTCFEQLKIAEKLRAVTNTLEFPWGQTDIESSNFSSMAVLRDFAAVLSQHTELLVDVEGHCAVDAPTYIARPFSQQRADSVRDQLVAMGVAGDRIRAVGYGKQRALDRRSGYGRFDAGGDKNRRVEIFVTHNGLCFPPRPELTEGVTVFNCEESDPASLEHMDPVAQYMYLRGMTTWGFADEGDGEGDDEDHDGGMVGWVHGGFLDEGEGEFRDGGGDDDGEDQDGEMVGYVRGGYLDEGDAEDR